MVTLSLIGELLGYPVTYCLQQMSNWGFYIVDDMAPDHRILYVMALQPTFNEMPRDTSYGMPSLISIGSLSMSQFPQTFHPHSR